MSGTDLARYPNLWKRGNRYYLRMRVPADLASVERREHIAISLQTSDFQDAVRRYRDVQGGLEQQFKALRQRLAEREAVAAALSDGHLERLTEGELERVAREWFDARAHLGNPASAISRATRANRRAADIGPLARDLLASGLSLRQIAVELDRRAVRTPRGAGGWSATQVRRMLLRSNDDRGHWRSDAILRG